MRDGGAGYDGRFLRRLARVLPHADDTLILSNAGAADPLALARAVRELLDSAPATRSRTVAAVLGDDVSAVLPADAPILGTDLTVGDLEDRVVSANAYVGAAAVDFQVGVNDYLYGSRFISYLALTYGPERMVDWLRREFPARAQRVINRIREMRGGKLNNGNFFERYNPEGEHAAQIKAMFDLHHRRLGFVKGPKLDASHFRRPGCSSAELLGAPHKHHLSHCPLVVGRRADVRDDGLWIEAKLPKPAAIGNPAGGTRTQPSLNTGRQSPARTPGDALHSANASTIAAARSRFMRL